MMKRESERQRKVRPHLFRIRKAAPTLQRCLQNDPLAMVKQIESARITVSLVALTLMDWNQMVFIATPRSIAATTT